MRLLTVPELTITSATSLASAGAGLLTAATAPFVFMRYKFATLLSFLTRLARLFALLGDVAEEEAAAPDAVAAARIRLSNCSFRDFKLLFAFNCSRESTEDSSSSSSLSVSPSALLVLSSVELLFAVTMVLLIAAFSFSSFFGKKDPTKEFKGENGLITVDCLLFSAPDDAAAVPVVADLGETIEVPEKTAAAVEIFTEARLLLTKTLPLALLELVSGLLKTAIAADNLEIGFSALGIEGRL